jgi:hypothetical protein
MPPDPNLIVHEVFSWIVQGRYNHPQVPIVRYHEMARAGRSARERSSINGRLERIEAAVDAIAVEVERISESQRFTARLQSEHAASRLPGTTDSARTQ